MVMHTNLLNDLFFVFAILNNLATFVKKMSSVQLDISDKTYWLSCSSLVPLFSSVQAF